MMKETPKITLPSIGFGTADLGGAAEMAAFTALEQGYRLIDTARAYESEIAVGKALKNALKELNIQRHQVVIQTKLSPSVSGYDETLEDFEKSLEALQTDYIDVYFIHWPVIRGNEKIYHEKNIETWKAFEKLYHEKKIRMLGICNFLERHLMDIFEQCEIMPGVHQLELHPGYQQKGLVAFSRKYHMSIEAWSPMGRGILNQSKFISMAEKYNKSIGQLALRWSIEKGFIPLTRSKNSEHIMANKQIMDFGISEKDIEILEELNSNLGFMDIWSYKRQQMY